ncbi:DNA-directed RNA polymerases I and III subunit RPAC2-like [Dysidea avara]|uniref:DNA-directed RNA polymerases I and III subunit RPAC2-like n=1 Tax=Dysidea avara TaxID=196820 RepID=UPI00332B548A
MSGPGDKEVEIASCSADGSNAVFVFHGEDHTLGNALRGVISQNPDVTLCTYNVPHPSKHCINFRIQTKGAPAIDILQKGLEDLSSMCDHIVDVFQKEVDT